MGSGRGGQKCKKSETSEEAVAGGGEHFGVNLVDLLLLIVGVIWRFFQLNLCKLGL